MEPTANLRKTTDRILVVVLALIALGFRLLAARSAHPACGDALHFIEFGWRLAQGDLTGLSNYWSQGQILVAAAAFLTGLDPQLTLQATTMAAGTLAASLLYLLARRLDASVPTAVVAGLLVAINPFLINLSITGYSEVPYLTGWLAGSVFLLSGGAGWRRILTAVLAGFGFGASIYFRMTDAIILIGLTLASYGALEWLVRKCSLKTVAGRLLLVTAVILVALAPLSYHAKRVSGSWLPSSSKVHTIVIGADAYDSKWMYGLNVEYPWQKRVAAYEQQGLVGYLWENRADVMRRSAGNLANIVRLTSADLFPATVRLGPLAFLLVLAGCTVAALAVRNWKVTLLALLLLAAHSLALSIYFIFPRYMATTVTLLSLVLAGGVGAVLQSSLGRARGIAVGVCIVYLAVTARAAADAFHLEFMWYHYARWVAVADDLAPLLKPGEVFMAQGASVIAQRMGIYDRERFLEVPYEDMDTVARLCEEKGVRLVVASDGVRPHWPISEAVRNSTVLPPTWRVLREWKFDGDPWVNPSERMVLFEYQPERLQVESSESGRP